MTWFKVCDTLWGHDKAHHAGLEAMGLWVMAGSRAGQQLSDGFVPHKAVAMCGGTPEIAQRLVEAGLWLEVDGGYMFHDWTDNNPLRAEVEARRESDRERKRRVRAESARTDAGIPVGTGSSFIKSKSARPGIRAESTRTPPRLEDLCDLHAQDRATCPHCRSDAARGAA